ncbi:MAG: tetratricopeptide repeat protein, partial [Verrucomicrobiaceae bacterium]
MRELLTEVNPGPAGAATFDELDVETRAIAAQLTTGSQVELLERIERTLARNRAGDYRKRIANCLYDFRDLLLLNGALAAEVSDYADWRVTAMEWDDGFFSQPPQESWQYTPEEFELKGRIWEENLRKVSVALEAATAKAPPLLKPHWLIQNGAWHFKHLRFEDAAKLFTQVISEAPQHPRAEVARLMLARTHMEHWRRFRAENVNGGKIQSDEASAILQKANEALDAYLTAHPRGRFAPDIPGWRGGLAREQGQINRAIEFFLQQVDMTEHPEIVRRAVRECEACLEELNLDELEESVSDGGERYALPLAEIARRPIAALAVVYHFLDSESRQDFDELLARTDTLSEHDVTGRYLSPMLRMRRAGRQILPALAEEVAKQRENYGGTVWRPKYLAMLAWAASESGEHRQAVRLCDLAGTGMDNSDDLLFVRAVALQRAGELDEAIAAFRQLREKFPESPLNAGTQFRIATALRDKKEAGLAVVELLRMQVAKVHAERLRWNQEPGKAQEPQPVRDLQLDAEIGQWTDTLLQFAPLPELERGLQVPVLEPEIGARLRQILRQRHLVREDFEAAKRFAEPVAITPSGDEAGNREWEFLPWFPRFQGTQYPAELAGEEWKRKSEALIEKTEQAVLETEPMARAERFFALAEEWSEARGRLTLPSVDDFGLFRNEFYEGWALRVRNARFAGYSNDEAAVELEARDELRHAFRLYLQTVEAAPSGPLAARSLWRANDTLRRMAELSPWSSARAFETNASA